jgi:hypothetical protein
VLRPSERGNRAERTAFATHVPVGVRAKVPVVTTADDTRPLRAIRTSTKLSPATSGLACAAVVASQNVAATAAIARCFMIT